MSHSAQHSLAESFPSAQVYLDEGGVVRAIPFTCLAVFLACDNAPSQPGAGSGVGIDLGLKRTQTPPASTAQRAPRIARLLELAHKFQRMLDSGEVKSMAELARLGRVSRARITQIMGLLMLAPEIQEEVLWQPPEMSMLGLGLRDILTVCHTPLWVQQRMAMAALHGQEVERNERLRVPSATGQAGHSTDA